jgi:hypothetical protein
MVFLELLGVYPRFKTFDKPFSLWHVLIWGWKDHLSTYRKKLVYKEALKRSKYFLAFLSQIALVLGLIRKTEQAIILRLIPKEALLQIKRRIFVPEIDQEPN